MIKKILFIFILLAEINSVNAQFFRGLGFFIGATTSRHQYKNGNVYTDTSNYFIASYPPSHRSAERISWNAGLFVELLKFDYIRWQTELEYTNKGSIERELIDIVTGDRSGKRVNKYGYIQWNNYAKFLLPEGYRGTWYGMLGARLEYNLTKSIAAYVPYASNFPKITVTPDAAIGYEFTAYGSTHLFTELHYNPDVKKQYDKNDIKITNRTWELRVGLVFRSKKAIDDCNAPRYNDNYY